MNPSNLILEKGLTKLGIDGDDRILHLLDLYIEEIELFNSAYGLVKFKNREELIAKHILDSLAPLAVLHGLLNPPAENKAGSKLREHPAEIADIGSGAGLPGIPLAVCMAGNKFTLVERMGRRAGFLRGTLAVLSLSNVFVEEADAGELALKPEFRSRFDLALFRALSPIKTNTIKEFSKLLDPKGFIAAYKGRLESIEKELDDFQNPLNGGIKIFPLEVPFLKEERHLLVIGV